MLKIQAGQLDLLGVLYARHQRRAFAQCYRIVGNSDTSEDLVQESFLRVLRHRDKFRGESRFTTWFHRITSNVCLDHLGAQRREVAAFDEFAADRDGCETFTAMDESDVSVTRIAFDKLSQEKQQLLIMARIDGCDYKQIAEQLGTSEGAARVRVHRTMHELKSIIDELSESDS